MKEALKLFGTMLAIVVSVSVFRDLRPAATTAKTDSSITVCRPFVCGSDFDCPGGCGPCVDGWCVGPVWQPAF